MQFDASPNSIVLTLENKFDLTTFCAIVIIELHFSKQLLVLGFWFLVLGVWNLFPDNISIRLIRR